MERPEIVWLGRDNPVARELLADGVPMDTAAITRVILSLSGQAEFSVDSDAAPAVFAKSAGVVSMRLGSQPLQAGRYHAVLYVFTAAAPNGLVFERFQIEVKAP